MNERQPCVLCGVESDRTGEWLCQGCWKKLPHPMNYVLMETHDEMTTALARWEVQTQMCRRYLKAVYEERP